MSVRLDLIVGCNGAGKSSLIEHHVQPMLPRSVFVNADVIARARWPESPERHSYDAATIAAATRNALVESDRSFIAETVFSHESKLDLIDTAHQHGFFVSLYVVMIPESLAVSRVVSRVADGGHAVPEDKIRGRYRRVWPLAATAITRCERAFIYDNSALTIRQVAQFDSGLLMTCAEWPDWAPQALTALVRE